MKIDQRTFGTTADGQNVTLFTLTNNHGHRVEVMNFGATIVGVYVPDRDGKLENVNLGFPTLDGYLQRHPYFGSTVGRFCNRIAFGRFVIDGITYELATNLGPHHLHGGNVGFDALLWEATPYETPDHVGVRMKLVSADGDEGYPGTLTTEVDFTWNDAGELSYTFTATTDAATHVNLTNHAYWNLGGAGSGTVLKHRAKIDSEKILAVDEDVIPTGALQAVAGTALDIRRLTALGERIDDLAETNGFDHCYVIPGQIGTMRVAGIVVDPASGRRMEVFSTQPGVQLYTGNHLGGGPDCGGFGQHDGFCLETQHYPNSPNQPSFPTTLLSPGETLRESTTHRFGIA